MARDGSGNYSLPATMAVANTTASSVTVNSIMNDIAQALTDSINKDGTKAFVANQSMGNNKITNLATATALSDAATLAQVQSSVSQQAIAVTGTVDAILLAFSPSLGAYGTGMRIRWVSGGANTVTAPTVNCSSLGVRTIKKNPNGAALAVGDLGVAGTINEAIYNGTDFILLNPPVDVSGLATTASILGKQTISLPAGSMIARTTNGAAPLTEELATNDVMIFAWAFDASVSEAVQSVPIRMPKGWNEGTVEVEFLWKHPATATNFGVRWGARARAFSNDDALDAAWGTDQEVTDTGGTTADYYASSFTAAITIGGTPAEGDLVIFEFYRDPADAGDTMAVDAHLIGVTILYTINAAKDD